MARFPLSITPHSRKELFTLPLKLAVSTESRSHLACCLARGSLPTFLSPEAGPSCHDQSLPKFFGASVAGPSAVTYAFVIPPSTVKSVPLTKLLSSLARKSTACACSIASPNRPVGKWISRRWRLGMSVPSQSCRRGVLEVVLEGDWEEERVHT